MNETVYIKDKKYKCQWKLEIIFLTNNILL
jgi:hypothetical protein